MWYLVQQSLFNTVTLLIQSSSHEIFINIITFICLYINALMCYFLLFLITMIGRMNTQKLIYIKNNLAQKILFIKQYASSPLVVLLYKLFHYATCLMKALSVCFHSPPPPPTHTEYKYLTFPSYQNFTSFFFLWLAQICSSFQVAYLHSKSSIQNKNKRI